MAEVLFGSLAEVPFDSLAATIVSFISVSLEIMALFKVNIRNHVILILFFSYIYDAIRREFIESRSERLRQFQAQVARYNKQQHQNLLIKHRQRQTQQQGQHLRNRLTMRTKNTITRITTGDKKLSFGLVAQGFFDQSKESCDPFSSPSPSSSSSSSLLTTTAGFAYSGRNLSRKWSIRRVLWRKFKSLSSNDDANTDCNTIKNEAQFPSPSISPRIVEACNNNNSLVKIQQPQSQRQHQQHHIRQKRVDEQNPCTSQKALGPLISRLLDSNHLDATLEDCPLRELPKALRIYQRFSTTYICYSFVRYLLIVVLQYGLFDIDQIYSCYLPGRLSFAIDMAAELPLLSLVIIFYHVIYRYMWYHVWNRLNLDCFLFVSYRKEEIAAKEAALLRIENDPLKKLELYLTDVMFFQRIQSDDYSQNESNFPRYKLRDNRTPSHWNKMNQVIQYLSYFCLLNFAVLGIPIAAIIIYNLLSNDYFDKNYSFCRSFANRPVDKHFKWTYTDPYRMILFFFDGFDNLILLVDTACAMTWPFTAAIISTLDLSLRFETLHERLIILRRRLDTRQISQSNIYPGLRRLTISGSYQQKYYRLISSRKLERDIKNMQDDLIAAFEQVSHVDKFMKIFSAFCIFCWVVINITYELTSIMKNQFMKPDFTAQFLQALGIILLTITFAFIGRTNSRATRLYHDLCSVMAHDPNYETTKSSWLRVLEYYHTGKSRFSLHFGEWSTLSMTSYLKSVAWSASCALMLLNLVRYKLGQ